MNFDSTKDKLAKPKADPTAVKINRLHKECCAGMRTTLEKAIEAGKLLVAQKAKCGHGNWLPWVEKNLDFTGETARQYMRCHDNRERLNSKSTCDLTIEEFARFTEEPEAIVAELVVEPSSPRNVAQIAFPSKNGGTPVKLGGRPPAMMHSVSKPDESKIEKEWDDLSEDEQQESLVKRNREWMEQHLSATCGHAIGANISEEELVSLIRVGYAEAKHRITNHQEWMKSRGLL